MSKDSIPADVQMQITGIMRGYKRVRREYLRQRQEVMDAGNASIHDAGGKDHRSLHRPTEARALQLEELDRFPAFRQMLAVDHALDRVCGSFPGEMGLLLRKALLLNSADGREFPFERLNVFGVSRSGYYRLKKQLYAVLAVELGLVV